MQFSRGVKRHLKNYVDVWAFVLLTSFFFGLMVYLISHHANCQGLRGYDVENNVPLLVENLKERDYEPVEKEDQHETNEKGTGNE